VGCVVGEFIKSLVVHDNMLINGTASVDWIPTGDSPGDKLRSAITCLTYLSLTLVCHFNILPLERELKNPTRKRIVLVNLLGMLTAFGIYVVIGVFGYLSFLGNTMTDLTLNYETDDYLMAVARGGLFFAILFSTPVLFHPTRESINIFIGFLCGLTKKCGEEYNLNGDSPPTTSTQGVHRLFLDSGRKRTIWVHIAWLCEAVILFGATFLPACYIPQVNYVWNFVGSIGGFLVVYIMPPLFYLRIRHRYMKFRAAHKQSILSTWRNQQSRQSKVKDILAVVILVFGVLAMIASNVQAVLVAIDPHSTSSLYNEPCYYDFVVLNNTNHTLSYNVL
jgi:amino acid permease